MGFLKPKLVDKQGKLADMSKEEKRKIIEMQIKLMQERGEMFPAQLSDDDWDELLYMNSMNGIERLLQSISSKDFARIQRK